MMRIHILTRLRGHLAGLARDPRTYTPQLVRHLLRRPYLIDRRRTSLPRRPLHEIQDATFRYTYRGLRCNKNPFDIALYIRLIQQVRPATIIEIGSAQGGSALFLADQMRVAGLESHVISVDIDPPDVVEPGVDFLKGDVEALAASSLPDLLANCPRPLLVVEDGPHTFEGCRAALDFFHPYLQVGEYIVIEDGVLSDLGYVHLADGPNAAIEGFLEEHADSYTIDRDYCDFFGRNVTWNTNGYLRRTR